MHVQSSTNPTMESLTDSLPSGLVNVAPYETAWWMSQIVEEMKSQIAGELPLPCPLPYIGNSSVWV